MKRFDAIVIGGGAAGARAGALLAGKGLSVAIFEKNPAGSLKPCSGCISVKALNELGVGRPDSPSIDPFQSGSHICGIRIFGRHYDSGSPEKRRLLGITIDRFLFDGYLLSVAESEGARIMRGKRAECVAIPTKPGGLYEVADGSESCYAPFVIAADGAEGSTARKLGLKGRMRTWEYGVTLSCRVAAGSGWDSDDRRFDPSVAELYCISKLGGWGWLFPHGDGTVDIGVGMSGLSSRALEESFRETLEAMAARNAINTCDIRPRRYIIPAMGLVRRLGSNGVLLVGDAAGLADPFTGEGIYNALVSAGIAAEVVYEELSGRGAWMREGFSAKALTTPAVRYSLQLRRRLALGFGLSLLLTFAFAMKGNRALERLVCSRPFAGYLESVMAEEAGYLSGIPDAFLPWPSQ